MPDAIRHPVLINKKNLLQCHPDAKRDKTKWSQLESGSHLLTLRDAEGIPWQSYKQNILSLRGTK
jgi:hypothetical protein